MNQIQVSLSASGTAWHLTRVGELEYLTLSKYPPKDFTFKEIKKVPYIEINRQMLWNKGTEEEGTKPTLQYLSVPPKKQGQGLGKLLFAELLDYMKHSGISYLVFDNFDKGFWDAIKKRYKTNIEFPKAYKKRLGIVLQAGTDVSEVF